MTLTLPIFNQAKVLVAGDLMLDRYWTGSTDRISPEAPVPVVKIGGSDERLGGAANVALNLASLGCSVELLGLTGKDEASKRIETLAADAGIKCHLLQSDEIPTITKLRIISRHQQLIRMDFEDSYAKITKTGLLKVYEELLAEPEVVVLSDYGKGGLSECQRMLALAKDAGCKVLVDPKGDSFEKYRGAWLVTPNHVEFKLVAGDCESTQELIEKGENLRQEYEWHALLITLGERGMLLLEQDQEPLLIAAQAKDVFDVTGAGDTVIAVLAAATAAGSSLADSARIANIAASIVVGKLGTATASVEEINGFISQSASHEHACLTHTQLLERVAKSKKKNEILVMTNGCFDLLHPGHIRYLQEASKLGDKLIVAVNSDDSVRRLKGDSRPINPCADRMEMLAALDAVTWVVEFDEDTPQRIISEVLPHILVKGGDYQAEQIVGFQEVTAAGGSVKILPFADGYSSSRLIEKIQSQR